MRVVKLIVKVFVICLMVFCWVFDVFICILVGSFCWMCVVVVLFLMIKLMWFSFLGIWNNFWVVEILVMIRLDNF